LDELIKNTHIVNIEKKGGGERRYTLANLLYATVFQLLLLFLLLIFLAQKISRKTKQQLLKLYFTKIYPESTGRLKETGCK